MPHPSPPAAWMTASGLPQAWRGQAAWRVLDTAFGQGQRFLELWQAWSDDPDGCRMLHVVALAPTAPEREALLGNMARHPTLTPSRQELLQQWFGLVPGVHRLVLHGGRLNLSLCVGPAWPMLRELRFAADSIVMGPSPGTDHAQAPDGASEWDGWAVKALTRLCRRGTTLSVLPGVGLEPAHLASTGWVADPLPIVPVAAPVPWRGHYAPHWQIKTTRRRWSTTPKAASHCVVVGAGLAGAGVAASLASRGWRVTVLDAAAEPAAGASALPVGLLAPQLARDDGPRAQLSRAGIRMTLQAAHRLLVAGEDWARSGIAHVGGAEDVLPATWPEQARPWARAGWPDEQDAVGRACVARSDHVIWHDAAGWIKPARLVQAWLAQRGIRFRGNSHVHAIDAQAGQWTLYGDDGRVLAQAPQLVIACAGHSENLLRQALMACAPSTAAPAAFLSPVHGQVSWAHHTETDIGHFPSFPVNGDGSVAARIPWSRGRAWFAGATYEAAESPPLGDAQAHGRNHDRIAHLLPAAGAAVAPAFANTHVQAWRGTRWTVADRLPIVGAWPMAAGQDAPGLWVSTGMGSRGLTYAALCGELVAAQIMAEPLPLAAHLHACIDVRRLRARQPARHGAPPD